MVYYTWMKLVSNAKNVVLRAEIFLKKLLSNMQGVTEHDHRNTTNHQAANDFQFTVEIKQTAKGDATVSVKTRSDATAKEAGDMALAEYKRILGELKK